jgi:hypothetical protein
VSLLKPQVLPDVRYQIVVELPVSGEGLLLTGFRVSVDVVIFSVPGKLTASGSQFFNELSPLHTVISSIW